MVGPVGACQHLQKIRMRQQAALAIDDVGLALAAKAGFVDDLAQLRQFDLCRQHAALREAAAPRQDHAGLVDDKGDRAEPRRLGAGVQELGRLAAVFAHADAVGLHARDVHTLLPVLVDPVQRLDRARLLHQPVQLELDVGIRIVQVA